MCRGDCAWGNFRARAQSDLAQAVRHKKKKIAFPRRTWQIKPVTRVKESSRKYSRPCAKQDLQKLDE
jgi:hypothetical protein